MRVGDIKKMTNPHGEDFTVKILDLIEDNGTTFAEVEPVGFNGFTREVPIDRLKDVVNIEKVIKRYNAIMQDNCFEYHTIGTRLSQNTDDWNLRDMVAEADYVLSTYYEGGHSNADLKEEDPELWRSLVGKLKRFIKAYEPFIDGLKCATGHCSKYDN